MHFRENRSAFFSWWSKVSGILNTAASILELQRQRMLLQMEYEEERTAHEEASKEIGVARRVGRGDAWWPVRVDRSYYNSLNQLCIEVRRTPSGLIS